jgi:hypothetical protein
VYLNVSINNRMIHLFSSFVVLFHNSLFPLKN